jgi:hypothetical protein
MSRAARTIVLSACGLAVTAGARAQDVAPPRRHAIVIGLDRSEANIEGVSKLFHAEQDAKAIVAVLEEQHFEDIVPLVGSLARRETIVAALAKLVQEAKPQDTVLIYFAGHGVKAKWAERGSKSHSYWLSYDATLASLEVKGLRLEHVMDYVDDIPAGKKIVILDHCHSGTVELPKTVAGGGGGGGGGGRDAEGSLKIKRDLFLPNEFNGQVLSRVGDEGLLILGSATDAAYELPTLGHGLFTSVLLAAIGTKAADAPPDGNNDGKLSADELVKYLNKKVGKLATDNSVKQEPIFLTRGSVLGWDLMTLPQDTNKETQDLLGVVGGLAAADPPLAARVVEACRLAIKGWGDARRANVPPTQRDLKIVTRLQELQARGAGIDWSSEAQILAGFVARLDQP